MKWTAFKIAFLIYVFVTSVVLVMCILLLYLDSKNTSIYSPIITFILGKNVAHLIQQASKSRGKAVQNAAREARILPV